MSNRNVKRIERRPSQPGEILRGNNRDELIRPFSCGVRGNVLGNSLSSRAGKTVIVFRFDFAIGDDELRSFRQIASSISGCAGVEKVRGTKSTAYVELAFYPGTRTAACYSAAVDWRAKAGAWLRDHPEGSDTERKRQQRQAANSQERKDRLPTPTFPFSHS